MRIPLGVSKRAKTKQCPLWRLCFFCLRLDWVGAFLLVAGGDGVLSVLALLAVVGGIDNQDVKSVLSSSGGGVELHLSSGEEGFRGFGGTQPTE